MTREALAGVPVDWQIQLAPGTDAANATDEYAKIARGRALWRSGGG